MDDLKLRKEHHMTDKDMNLYEPIDTDSIQGKIMEIRGYRVMLDKDIADYFGVETGAVNRAMKRNIKRFPESFCFRLEEYELSRCQIGISMQTKGSKGGRVYLPYAYTEQGVAMLTSVLHSERAIAASIKIIEAFVEMSHYIRQNSRLIPADELRTLELQHYKLADRVQNIEKNMVTRDDLSKLMQLFSDGIEFEEILILQVDLRDLCRIWCT